MRHPPRPGPLFTGWIGWIVQMEPACRGTHSLRPSVDLPGTAEAPQHRKAGADGVHVHVQHLDPAAGSDPDVRLRDATPPPVNLSQIGGGAVEATLNKRVLVAGHAREDRDARLRIRDRGVRERAGKFRGDRPADRLKTRHPNHPPYR